MHLARSATRRRPLGRAGFTFIELIVGLAIMVLIASMVAPALIGVLDDARRDAAVENLSELAPAIAEFLQDIGEYPGELTQLTNALTPAHDDLCGAGYSSAERDDWDGPYLIRFIPATGLPVGIGRVRNQLARFPNNNSPTHMVLTVDSVLVQDALALNEEIDDDGDDAGDNAVRWTTLSAPDDLVTLTFWGPISDTCP